MKMRKDFSEKKLLKWLRSQIIGSNAEFRSPFGKRRLTYADATATGRSLHFIQDYITDTLLPFYGNTHTSDSFVGQRSTKMVEEASQYIKRCLGGGEEDAILFCGSGTTSAIKRLQEVMGIAISSTLRNRVLQVLSNHERWIVFVGPFEHHSNLLSWRQSLAQVVEIGLSDDGGSVDMEDLRDQLKLYGLTNRPMLGSFSTCSNVTGIVTDTRAIARLLHQYGAFACFDFAASGPYVDIDMRSGEMDGYDAAFVSPHKFIGGPGSPGILLMSKKLYQLTSSPPSTCGGGTVCYVNAFSEEDTLYLDDIEEREKAGTPPILQTIIAALAFWVKEYIGYKTIEEQESYYMIRAMQKLGNIKNIQILGNTSVKRLAIFSILIYPTPNSSLTKHNIALEKVQIDQEDTQEKKREKPLHGRFVAKLLNDLFGIQARGGCACAGPYGHHLLNVDKAYSLALRSFIQKGYEGVKPGWTRICFPYYMSTEEFEYVLTAIEFVAIYGHRFLSLYHFNWKTGDWSFQEKNMYGRCSSKGVKYTTSINYPSVTNKLYASYLETAMYIATLLPKVTTQRRIPVDLLIDLPFMI